jgi:hypothetical protein
MTSDVDWEPSKFDNDITNLDAFHDPANDNHEEHHFDQHGEYRHCTVATHLTGVEEEFYDACEFLDLMIKLMTYWTPLIRKLLVEPLGCSHPKSARLIQTTNCFGRFSDSLQQIP